MLGHESDERRAYENERMRNWYNKMPTRNRDYDRLPSADDEYSDSLYKDRVKGWYDDMPEVDSGYDYY